MTCCRLVPESVDSTCARAGVETTITNRYEQAPAALDDALVPAHATVTLRQIAALATCIEAPVGAGSSGLECGLLGSLGHAESGGGQQGVDPVERTAPTWTSCGQGTGCLQPPVDREFVWP
jgi:hypothetical protein